MPENHDPSVGENEPGATDAFSKPAQQREDSDGQINKSELQQLIDGTAFLLARCNRDLTFRFVSPAYARMVGRQPQEIAGRPLREVLTEETFEKIQPYVKRVLEGERVEFEESVSFRETGDRFLLVIYTPDRDQFGDVVGWFASINDITERKKAEEALRASEERFRQFAENSADVFWILDAKTKRLEYVNPIYDAMFGQPREVILRDRTKRLEVVHPDDRIAAAAGLDGALAGETFVRNYRVVRPTDGETRWIRDIGFPIRDERGAVKRIAGMAQDVTADKERTEELARSEERFRLLVEGAREYAMFLIDPDNAITFWSKGAERIFGWTREEAVGQTADMIFTPEDRENGAVEKEIATALRDGRAPDRRFHLRKDGARFWVDGVLMRLDDEHGAVRGFAKVARDASDQRAIEDALRYARDEMEQRVVERTRDLLATNNELEQAMQERRQLEKELLAISEREKRRIGEDLHDMICQELTATALFLRSSARNVSSESPAASETLEEAAQIVNRNVGLARDLARGLQPAELSGSTLKQALKALADQASETSGITCHFKPGRGVRLTDDTIALHLYRVAQEAVKNAIKHSGAKNILISLDHDREAKHVCVSVLDDGKGFSPRKRTKGLGLHIMRYRANALGGELKIEKRPHGGMDITCKIPLKK